jgi:hypothetical protein
MNVYKIKIQFLLKLLILQYMQCAVPQEQSALTAPVSNLEQLFRTIVALYNQPNALEEAQNKVKELEKRVRALTKEIEEERGVEIFYVQPKK